MSEQNRQEQLAETLSLLGRMAPADLTANRDELFFRAGEASARGENRAASRSHRVAWPAAAAVLALLAAGLGAAIVMRAPEVRIVYVERTEAIGGNTGRRVDDLKQGQIAKRDGRDELVELTYPLRDDTRRDLPSDGMIARQDWAALSDAFAQQFRLQRERSQAARDALLSSSAANESDQHDEESRGRARTYLELRDLMQAM